MATLELAKWRLWIDVGGTFTDCIAISPTGVERELKILSSSSVKNVWQNDLLTATGMIVDSKTAVPCVDFWRGYTISWQDAKGETFASGIVDHSQPGGELQVSLEKASSETSLSELSRRAAYYELVSPEPSPIFAARLLTSSPLEQTLPPLAMVLGTTRGTNALLTRTGAKTALAVTAGFRDLLEIGEQDRPALFELTIRKPRPLYEQVFEIDERLDANGEVLLPLDLQQTAQRLTAARQAGCDSLAICLLHSYRNPEHERMVEELARRQGFFEISCSSVVSPLIKIVPRAETTVLDAYLNPVIRNYADHIARALSAGSTLELMTSAGGLVPRHRFSGKDSVLSGPAGGVVGFARVAEQAGFTQAIGFDMGGTSTDVARYGGRFERDFESRKAGVRIVAPMLAIETVAAGGGSICRFNGTQLVVGPESAGSVPGPACYGRGGPLAVTDINVFLGRISEQHFPFALDRNAIARRLDECAAEVQLATGRSMSHAELAEGFLKIANHNMAAAIRNVSVAQGYDPREHVLVAFGGAGPQHAVEVAELLEMSQVLVHPRASLLSAEGIRLAERRSDQARAVLRPLSVELLQEIQNDLTAITDQAVATLVAEGGDPQQIDVHRSLDLRFQGTEPFLNLPLDDGVDVRERFLIEHRRLFGYVQDRAIEVVAMRVEATIRGEQLTPAQRSEPSNPQTDSRQTCWTSGGWSDVARFDWKALPCGSLITGPALIADALTTTWVADGWQAEVLSNGSLLLGLKKGSGTKSASEKGVRYQKPERPFGCFALLVPDPFFRSDPIQLEIFSNSFRSIARQMGLTLQRTAVSVNIKDRLDFSCAIFLANGELIVNAPHIPVHLGAMSETVRGVIANNPVIRPGDVFITNDPFAGGSHLPDVSVVSPVFVESELMFWVASRGHHAEIGGKAPGSMPPDATCLADEGVVISNLKLIDAGAERFDELERILRQPPYPSRNVADNLADVRAQVAANQIGANALVKLIERHSAPLVGAYMGFLLDAAERQVRAALLNIPDGDYRFQDAMDNGKRIFVAIAKTSDRLRIDFSGTDEVSSDNLNANRAIVLAAIMYTMRCLLKTDLPLNEGVLRPVELQLPTCFLNPTPGRDPTDSPAIVGGNVETSQRIVDVLLGALGLAAASQGTMNNWLMGDDSFGYYETIGGGSGATAEGPGADAVHCHMTNTRLTDPEILESRFPVRLLECAIARGSGGAGWHRGGCGMVRTVEFLRPLVVSLLTSRRTSRPYGLQGGEPGDCGQNLYRPADGEWISLPSRIQLSVGPGDQLKIITPGGGGWGAG
ncbi:MAG: hydantoinase B/oxoprolinase family protein [Pirellulaceae bacterium]|nr:hydantoinase B/oxoprolinase family protein [Pirellulaceae bacterium]